MHHDDYSALKQYAALTGLSGSELVPDCSTCWAPMGQAELM